MCTDTTKLSVTNLVRSCFVRDCRTLESHFAIVDVTIFEKLNGNEEEIQGEDEKGGSSEHCFFGTHAGLSPMSCQEKEEVVDKALDGEKAGSREHSTNLLVKITVEDEHCYATIFQRMQLTL